MTWAMAGDSMHTLGSVDVYALHGVGYQWHTAQVVRGQETDNRFRKLDEVHLERGVLEVPLKVG